MGANSGKIGSYRVKCFALSYSEDLKLVKAEKGVKVFLDLDNSSVYTLIYFFLWRMNFFKYTLVIDEYIT